MYYYEKNSIFAVEMDLERHIEILLLDNDCVIVPGLGGFIAYHTDARYDAESASFLPPTRIAGFNPKLSMNDNLLAQSYVETYDISYPEAVKKISSEADALKSELERNGFYEISGVGTLKVNDEKGYDFEPFEAGLLTPDYYGLGCFEAAKLISEPIVKEEIVNKEEVKDDKSGKVVRIKISSIRNFAAAAVAIIAFFLLSSPLGNSDKNMASVASLQNGVFYKMMPQGMPFTDEDNTEASKIDITVSERADVKSVNKVTAKPAVKPDTTKIVKIAQAPAKKAAEPKVVKETKKEVKVTKVEESKDYFCIVLASALSKSNAENFVKKLTAEGNKNIHAVDCSSGMKVVYGKFENEKDARSSLDTMRSRENFKDAWIYKVKANR